MTLRISISLDVLYLVALPHNGRNLKHNLQRYTSAFHSIHTQNFLLPYTNFQTPWPHTPLTQKLRPSPSIPRTQRTQNYKKNLKKKKTLNNLQAFPLLPDKFSFITHLTIAILALIKEKEERPLLPQALVLNISSPKKLAPITKGNVLNVVPTKLLRSARKGNNGNDNEHNKRGVGCKDPLQQHLYLILLRISDNTGTQLQPLTLFKQQPQ